jgi:hypothetical protein
MTRKKNQQAKKRPCKEAFGILPQFLPLKEAFGILPQFLPLVQDDGVL